MLKIFCLVLLIAVSVNSDSKFSEQELKDIQAGLKKATTYVTEARKALEEKDPKKFVASIGKLVSMIPGKYGSIGGGVLGAISGVLPGAPKGEELQAVLDKITQINGQIDTIAQDVQHMKEELKMEVRFLELAKQETALADIDHVYKNLVGSDSKVKRDRMILTCENAKYTTIAKWFYNEIMDKHTTQPIASEIRKKNDRQKYLQIAKVLVGDFIQATVLQTACTSVIYGNQTAEELQQTLEDDSNKYQEMLNEIKNKIDSEDDVILAKFWESAQADVEKWLEGKQGTAHAEIANIVHANLKEKYGWRHWFVAVYGDQNTAGFPTHSYQWHNTEGLKGGMKGNGYESYFRSFIRLNNRNVIIASPNGNPPSSFIDKARQCITETPKKRYPLSSCEDALSLLKSCIGKTLYMAVGCAKDQKPFAIASDTDGVVHQHVYSSHTGGFTASITMTFYFDLFFTY